MKELSTFGLEAVTSGPFEPLERIEQIKALPAPNLEHAALCVESARQVAYEMGAREHLAVLGTSIEHALHFLQLARGYVAHLQDLQDLQALPPQPATEQRS